MKFRGLEDCDPHEVYDAYEDAYADTSPYASDTWYRIRAKDILVGDLVMLKASFSQENNSGRITFFATIYQVVLLTRKVERPGCSLENPIVL